MALTLTQQTAASRDQAVYDVVRAAAVATAVIVYSESAATFGHTTRALFAQQVAKTPDPFVPAFAAAIASTGLDKTASDANVLAAVASVWNLLAGV